MVNVYLERVPRSAKNVYLLVFKMSPFRPGYSQTDAYALRHVVFSPIQRWMLMPCGIFDFFGYAPT